MKLGHIEIFVTDPSEARRFYEKALGFQVTAVEGDGRFIWLKLGDQEFLLRPASGTGRAPRGVAYDRASTGIVLYTDDLPATCRRLEERGVVFRGQDGGDDCPTFTDPDGNWFQLVDPGDQ
jgi:catechol 2,3-dioxygenase-like lactoylglutathione lyase family enzyme